MKIIGIDPGSALCGWAIVESDGHDQKLVESGCVKTHNHDTTAKRLQILHDTISSIIKKHGPQEAAVEELFFVKNIKTGIAVGQARGAILLALSQNDVEISEYKPTVIKQALTGYGHADKKQVQDMVKCILKLKNVIAQDDENDAVAVALCHAQCRTSYNMHPNTPEIVPKKTPEREGLLYADLSYEIVGALYDTFKQLGSGLPEKYYYAVVAKKLKERGLTYQQQLKVNINGLPVQLGRFYVDFVVEDKIVLELKTGNRFLKKDIDQIMNYLRQSKLELGILARFTQQGVITKRLLLGY